MRLWTRLLLFALLILPLVATAPPAPEVPKEFISVSLTPETHKISATAVVVLSVPENRTLEFALNAKLDFVAVNSLSLGGKELNVPLHTGKAEGAVRWHTLRLPDSVAPGDRAALALTYSGAIYDPVKTAGDLTFVVGDSTTGLIGDEGIYLTGETGWYPVLKSPLARFELRVKVPAPWEIVSQSELRKRDSTATENSFLYVSDVPTDSLALVGGKYQVQTAEADGVKVSTYFFADEAGLAPLYLNAVTGYLKRFSALLGPYPYKKFDVVENFFTSGYGFPSFTLLGNDVIKMGERALRPGYLDHEIVHCWYGNGLFFDPAKGNWVEGLTTYIANYLGNEAQGPEAARRYRLVMSQKYSLRVKPDKDYPLRKFEGKTEDFENDIGYSKAAMVFHMLRRLEGDDAFFGVLKDFTQANIGRVVKWEDFGPPMETGLGADLGWLFDDWLERPGLPELAFDEVWVSHSNSGYRLKGRILQRSEKPYHLPLTVRVEFEGEGMEPGGFRDFGLWIDSPATPFQFPVERKPRRIRLDPDYQILRRLSNEEMPPSLNSVLNSGSTLIVLPSKASDEMKAVYQKVADRAKAARGGEILLDSQVQSPHWNTYSFLVLGSPDENSLTKDLIKRPGRRSAILDDNPARSILYSLRPTWNTYATIYYGNSTAALVRANYIFYYGWDSFVVFENGAPLHRGYFESDQSPASLSDLESRFGDRAPTSAAAASFPNFGVSVEQLRADVEELAGSKYRGRFTADPEHRKAARYIARRFEHIGLSSRIPGDPFWDYIVAPGYGLDFLISSNRLGPANSVAFTRGSETRTARMIPFFFCATDILETAGPAPLYYAGRDISGDDFDGEAYGRIVVLEDGWPGDQPPAETDTNGFLASRIWKARTLRPPFVIVLYDENAPSFSPYYLAYENNLPPDAIEKIEEEKQKGSFFGLHFFLSRQQSRLPEPSDRAHFSRKDLYEAYSNLGSKPPYLDFPITVAVTRTEFEAAIPEYRHWRENPVTPHLTDGLLTTLQTDIISDKMGARNVVGFLPEPGRKALIWNQKPGLVVGAHYDHLGFNNNAELMPGAVDNASGVAALLAIAEYYARHPNEHPAPIWFVAFDAEEWGLRGSGNFLLRFAKPDAFDFMINLDSLAGGKDDSVYLIGRSHYPDLVPVFEKAFANYGISLAPDIDKYAFQFGSDFYSFFERGVPAAGFFDAQYREIHKPTDTVDKVNFGRLAREAAAVIELIQQLMTQ